YREAVKTGFYEFTAARDAYREACAVLEIPMNKELILRYIEVQTLLISPIVSHWAEHVWSDLLGKPNLVVNARYPKAGPVDESVLNQIEYIRRQLGGVRATETQALKRKAKGNPFDPLKPKKITIYV